jgi:hypothetical protein
LLCSGPVSGENAGPLNTVFLQDSSMLTRFPSALAFALLAAPAATIAADAPRSYYVEPGTLGTQRETDPPAYVKNVGATRKNSLTWLDAGLEYRLRYEYRDDDLRRVNPNDIDKPLLRRTRAWLGVKEVLDPLRFAVELTDSRENASHYQPDNRDVNEMEFIQGYAELYFPSLFANDPRGNARPLSIRAGRMAFEALDRRMVARNEWRNTTNNFEGVRVQLGNDNNDWAVEGWSFHPITRLLEDTDKPNLDVRFNALIAHWRPWSPSLTIEPHYFQLKQDGSAANAFRERNIFAPGLRVHGRFANNAWNYDITVMKQHGTDGGQQVDGESLTAEIGYTWADLKWRPRLSAFYGYASGDKNPNDNRNDRFERFFGFGRPWSSDDYIVFENIHSPKLKLEFQPITGVRVDGGYNFYRLASGTDRFPNLLAGGAANRDRTGRSGSEIGSNWDMRVRFTLMPHVQATVGYSYFKFDEFPKARQQAATRTHADDSDFAYIELVYRLFE